MTENKVSVAVTGVGWMGSGIGSIESAMGQLFEEASFEVILTVYAISSEVDLLFEWLEKALSRGVEIKIIINQLDEQPPAAIHRLSRLVDSYKHIHLYSFVANMADLHSKVVIVDRVRAIVGSSNLSQRGFLSNYELALVVEGPIVTTLANAVDRLISIPYTTCVNLPS